ncbi:MAG: hypothetical protein WA761_03815 [Thermoplasmata archaeon]
MPSAHPTTKTASTTRSTKTTAPPAKATTTVTKIVTTTTKDVPATPKAAPAAAKTVPATSKVAPEAAKPHHKPRKGPGKKVPPKLAPSDAARIAVVGIPASGKTTYFRFLSGHFGLNLPVVYVPTRSEALPLPLYGDLDSDVVLEETTYETSDPTDPEGSLETTSRYYVSRPMEDRTHLWIELAASREDQGVLTKYPLPTKYNQFVEMKMHFRYGNPDGSPESSRRMILHTIDEAGGIISDYFTYDRLWVESSDDIVDERRCHVIPHFATWRADRRDLWRRGLTLLGRFVHDAEAIILLLSPSLPSLRDQAQQINLARGVFRYVNERQIPLIIAISKADRLRDFYGEIEHILNDRAYRSTFDTSDFLLRRDGAGMGTVLVANDGRGLSTREDVFMMSSAVSTGEGHPMLTSDGGAADPNASGGAPPGVPVMVNITLPLARACERVLGRRETHGG